MNTKGEFRRVERCGRIPIGEITISHTLNGDVYHGLETCGNGKLCPVCASRIATERGNEIKELCNVAYKDGKRIVMITLTHPHKAGNRLAESLKMQSKAVRSFMSGGAFTDFKKAVGFVGAVRATEITYGLNGWHVHTHSLFVIDKNADFTLWNEKLLNKWKSSVLKAGFKIDNEKAFSEHGYNMQDNCHASDYLTKGTFWGIDNEITTGGTIKETRSDNSKTPFELADGNETEQKLFIEYAHAVHGAKLLFWSKGLKEYAKVNEITDKEIMEQVEENEIGYTVISRDVWKCILANNFRGQFLIMDYKERCEWLSDYGLTIQPPILKEEICTKYN